MYNLRSLMIFGVTAACLLIICLASSPNPALTFIICLAVSFIPARRLISRMDMKGRNGAVGLGSADAVSKDVPLGQFRSNLTWIAPAIFQGIGAGGAIYMIFALVR